MELGKRASIIRGLAAKPLFVPARQAIHHTLGRLHKGGMSERKLMLGASYRYSEYILLFYSGLRRTYR